MLEAIQTFWLEQPSWQIGMAVFAWFAMMYFGMSALVGLLIGRQGDEPGMRVVKRDSSAVTLGTEITRSMLSCIVFGLQGVMLNEMDKAGWVNIQWGAITPWLALELFIAFWWNEIHFYCAHRLLHTRWLYRHVHCVHHQSLPPTPYSSYSFHWFEAFVLGSVVPLAACLYDFHAIALTSIPLISIVYNCFGHSNRIFGRRLRLVSHHAELHAIHHLYSKGNYAFSVGWFDRLFGTRITKK